MSFFSKIILFAVAYGMTITIFAAEVVVGNSELVLKNRKVAVTFDKNKLTLKQIRDLQRKADFITSPGSKLFTVAFWDPADPGPAILNHPKFSTNFDMAMAINGDKGMELIYFDPNEAIIKDMQRIAPRSVKLY